MNLKKRLESWFAVNHGEWGRLGLFFLLYFATSFGGCVGLNVGESLFISRFQGIRYLPHAFLAAFTFIILITFGFNWIRSKYSLKTYTAVLFGLLLGLLGLLYPFILKTSWPGYAAILFLIAYLALYVVKTTLLDLAEAAYDLRQFKRLFPLFSSGAVLGFALGGLSTGKILHWVGRNENLLPVWMLLLTVAALVAFKIIAGLQIKETAEEKQPSKLSEIFLGGFKNLSRSKLFLYLSLLSFFTAFSIMFFDYIYIFLVNDALSDNPEAITALFGKVRGLSTLSTFVLQLALTPFLMRTFGIGRMLLIFPGVLFFFYALLSRTFTLSNTIAGRFGYYITKEAFFFPSFQPHLGALKEDIRKTAPLFIYNITAALGSIAAGLYLMFFVSLKLIALPDMGQELSIFQVVKFTLLPHSWVLAALCLAMFYVAWKVRKAYIKELIENLSESSPRQLDMFEAIKNMRDEETLTRMRSILSGNDTQLILFVIESLKSMRTREADHDVIQTLRRTGDSEIARKVFEYFEGTFNEELLETVDQVLVSENIRTKLVFLDWLGRLKQPAESKVNLTQFINSFFYDDHPEVKMKAAALLVLSGNEKYVTAVTPYIHKSFKDAGPEDLIKLIESVSGSLSEEFARLALEQNVKYLDHSVQPSVGYRYISALSKFNYAPAWIYIIDHSMTKPEFRKQMEEILSGLNENLCADVSAILTDLIAVSHSRRASRYLSALLLCLPHKTTALETLLIEEMHKHPDEEYLIFNIASNLAQFKNKPDEKMQEKSVDTCCILLERIEEGAAVREAIAGKAALLAGIYADELDRLTQKRLSCILHLLLFIFSGRSAAVAVTGLKAVERKTRISSMETLENLLPRRLTEPLFLLLENNMEKLAERRHLRIAGGEIEKLVQLFLAVDSNWLNALAVHTAQVFKLDTLKPEIEKLKSVNGFLNGLKKEYLLSVQA